jgi:hypothetical protein
MKTQKSITARRITSALALASVIAISASSALAQVPESASGAARLATAGSQNQVDLLERRVQRLELFERMRKSDESFEKRAQRLEGSWTVTVTPAVPPGVPQPPAFIAQGTVARGGALFGSDRNRASSKQHGTWEYLGGDEFAWTLTEDFFDVLGNFAGTFKVRARITVIGEDLFIGVSNGEQRDVAGNLLFNRCGTIRGDRLKIEPLAPQCQNIVPPQ